MARLFILAHFRLIYPGQIPDWRDQILNLGVTDFWRIGLNYSTKHTQAVHFSVSGREPSTSSWSSEHSILTISGNISKPSWSTQYMSMSDIYFKHYTSTIISLYLKGVELLPSLCASVLIIHYAEAFWRLQGSTGRMVPMTSTDHFKMADGCFCWSF